MAAEQESRLLRRIVACVLAFAIVVRVSPARADSIAENVDGPWPTEKKVVVWTLVGASVITLGIGAFSFAKAADARASLRDDFPARGERSALRRLPDRSRMRRTAVDPR